MFSCLVEDVSKAYSEKVVLLVDEYDAPVIKVVQTPGLSKIEDLFEDTRTVMSNFYSKIKDLDEELHFVFITVVTKFSKMGVFSTLNNLTDISLLPEFASFIGFTHEELVENFKPFIAMVAGRHGLSETETLDKIRDYYDGFYFDGLTRLYNPFSTLNFFRRMVFENFWMESGSNTLIREMIKGKSLTVDQFSGFKVGRDFAMFPGEIEKTPPEGFLYQAGYLTLRKDPKIDSSFTLDYPNFEVRSSMSRLFFDALYRSDSEAGVAIEELKACIEAGDTSVIVNHFIKFYSKIPYDDYTMTLYTNMFLNIIIQKNT